MTFTVLSLFSGIGGLDLGLQRAGMTIAGQVEIDPWCRRVLAKHWPEVPRHDDVRTCADWWGGRRAPNLVAGGPPCQPVSWAGKQLAQADERWLWPEMAAVVASTRPAWVIVENVPNMRKLGLADVLSDLTRLGYRARAGYISACAMGAPHPRRRLFVLAHAESVRCGNGRNQGIPQGTGTDTGRQMAGVAETAGPGKRTGASPWATEPGVGRVADGVPDRVDRLRGLGNAVVPAVAEHIGRMVMSVSTANCDKRN